MLEHLVSEASPLWAVAVLFLFTTSNSTSPLGALLGLLLAARPPALAAAWAQLQDSASPLTILGRAVNDISRYSHNVRRPRRPLDSRDLL